MYKIICTRKKDGNMSYKYSNNRDLVTNNKNKIFKKFKLNKCVLMQVTNKDKISYIDNFDSEEVISDTIITKTKNVFIYLNYGDCIPMITYDKKQNIIGYTHLGWQSTNCDLHIKTIDYFIKKLNSNIKDLKVILGPSIKKDSYILKNPIQLNNSRWNDFLYRLKEDYYKIDLNGYIVNGLKDKGIKHIKNSKIDTVKDERYFSQYRCKYINKDEINGRFMYGVYLKS
ncbi:MAG: polyphenol oxidase family protein [Bacilli bacterium]|nr:polyphenol oxidase family protein [Bacilli bacterium]